MTPSQKFENISFIVDTTSRIHVMAEELHLNTGLEFGDFCQKAELIKRGLDLVIEKKQELREDQS